MQTTAAPSQRGPDIHPEASVHASAVIEGDVTIGPRTRIGPGCVVWGTVGPVRIGAGCTLVANATVNGPISLGDGNVLYPQASLGFAPQDLGFDAGSPGPGCIIGNRNVFREGATVHRGKTAEPTRMGDSNYWMTNSHLGHDGVVGSNCVIGSGAVLGGHVTVGDRVIMGGLAALHQFVRVGRGAFISGLGGASVDVPPWVTVSGINVAVTLNAVGLRRSGAARQDIDVARWAFRTLFRRGVAPTQALPGLEARAGHPFVDEWIAFIRASRRGICHAQPRGNRGVASAAAEAAGE